MVAEEIASFDGTRLERARWIGTGMMEHGSVRWNETIEMIWNGSNEWDASKLEPIVRRSKQPNGIDMKMEWDGSEMEPI